MCSPLNSDETSQVVNQYKDLRFAKILLIDIIGSVFNTEIGIYKKFGNYSKYHNILVLTVLNENFKKLLNMTPSYSDFEQYFNNYAPHSLNDTDNDRLGGYAGDKDDDDDEDNITSNHNDDAISMVLDLNGGAINSQTMNSHQKHSTIGMSNDTHNNLRRKHNNDKSNKNIVSDQINQMYINSDNEKMGRQNQSTNEAVAKLNITRLMQINNNQCNLTSFLHNETVAHFTNVTHCGLRLKLYCAANLRVSPIDTKMKIKQMCNLILNPKDDLASDSFTKLSNHNVVVVNKSNTSDSSNMNNLNPSTNHIIFSEYFNLFNYIVNIVNDSLRENDKSYPQVVPTTFNTSESSVQFDFVILDFKHIVNQMNESKIMWRPFLILQQSQIDKQNFTLHHIVPDYFETSESIEVLRTCGVVCWIIITVALIVLIVIIISSILIGIVVR